MQNSAAPHRHLALRDSPVRPTSNLLLCFAVFFVFLFFCMASKNNACTHSPHPTTGVGGPNPHSHSYNRPTNKTKHKAQNTKQIHARVWVVCVALLLGFLRANTTSTKKHNTQQQKSPASPCALFPPLPRGFLFFFLFRFSAYFPCQLLKLVHPLPPPPPTLLTLRSCYHAPFVFSFLGGFSGFGLSAIACQLVQ